MARIGYARVSTTDQDTAIQTAALRAAGCDVVREERVSASSMHGRKELAVVLDFIRSGDVLVVTRVDRLARSVLDLQNIVAGLRAKGAALECTEQPVDTSTAAGNAFLSMLGVFAEFETALRRERQAEGIAKAKAEGRYKGRVPTVPVEEVRRRIEAGERPATVARALGVARSSVYRAMEGGGMGSTKDGHV